MSEEPAPGLWELVVEFSRPYAVHVYENSDCCVRIQFLFEEDAEQARQRTDMYVREVPRDEWPAQPDDPAGIT